MFVVVEDGGKPSLGICLEIGVCQKWNGQGNIALWWSKIAVGQRLVDKVNGSTASWFFNATNGIHFELSVSSRT